MPTYEYKCAACEHAFEQFQSMKDKTLRTCPSCKKPKLERLIGIGAAVLFKGSGFYQTDYRSESYKKAADADKPAGASSDSKPNDSKPGDSKASDSKPSDSKSSDSKPVESKSSDAGAKSSSKPVGQHKPAKKRRAGK